MIERIRLWIIWMMRWRYCRGFGVQSPFAYSFIRYVINEHYPYYAYKKLKKKHKAKGPATIRCGEFYLRLANYLQPAHVLLCMDDDDWRKDYILAGCRCATVSQDADIRQTQLLITDAEQLDENAKRMMAGNSNERKVIIAENIKKSPFHRKQWHDFAMRDGIDVTFDLYHMGVVFINTGLHKAHYTVNF